MRKSMFHLLDLLRAGTQCIWLKTPEETEALEDLKELMLENQSFMQFSLFVWSLTTGLMTVPLLKGYPAPVEKSLAKIDLFFDSYREKANNGTLGNSFYVFLDLQTEIEKPKTWRAIRDIKENVNEDSYNPFIVISNDVKLPEEVAHLFTIVDYGLPDAQEIEEIVNDYDSKAEHKDLIVSACLGMTRMKIEDTIRKSMVKHHAIAPEYILDEKIEEVKKSGALDFKIPKSTMNDIGGNEILKSWLMEEAIILQPEVRNMGCPAPKGYMAVGVPGCSKTKMAEAFAGTLGVPFLELSVAKVFNSLVGSSEKKIENALAVAKQCAPCVLLIDEIEKKIGGINSSNNSDSGITARVFQTILQFMNEDTGVYTIMTSNDVSQLPPELTRAGRLDTTWFFDLPDKEERRAIWKIHLDKAGIEVSDKVMDYAVDISNQFTGAEIEQAVHNVMRKAYVAAARYGKEVSYDEDLFKDATDEIVPVSRSSAEKIMRLRAYCKGRARRTSASDDNGEKAPNKGFIRVVR